jgi:hypothetical protein
MNRPENIRVGYRVERVGVVRYIKEAEQRVIVEIRKNVKTASNEVKALRPTKARFYHQVVGVLRPKMAHLAETIRRSR